MTFQKKNVRTFLEGFSVVFVQFPSSFESQFLVLSLFSLHSIPLGLDVNSSQLSIYVNECSLHPTLKIIPICVFGN